MEAIGYRGELERTAKTPEQALFRWENVEAVQEAVEAYESDTSTPTLRGFLDASALNSDADRRSAGRENEDAVSLMTIHSAKGLEFSFVFIAGVEEGLLPHERSLRDGAIEEERRLFYVALTRAKRHVVLFETVSRTLRGRERPSVTSRFVKEIPAELLEIETYAAREGMDAASASPKGKAATRPKKGKRRARA